MPLTVIKCELMNKVVVTNNFQIIGIINTSVNFYRSIDNSIDDIFKINDLLFENDDIDRIEVSYQHLFQHLWSIGHKEIIPFLPKIEYYFLLHLYNVQYLF